MTDAVLVAVSVALVVYAAASAPWWAVAAAGATAMVIGLDPVLVACGAVALLIGLWIGSHQVSAPHWRAIAVGIALNVLAWSQLEIGAFGLGALISIGVASVVFVTGILRRRRRVRRIAWWTLGVLAGLTMIALAGFGASAVRARTDLRAGQAHANAGVTALNDGDVTGAATEFAAASTSLRAAHDQLSGPLVAGASVLPVIAQHRDVAVETSKAAADATSRIASALDGVDLSALRFSGGGIDLGAVTVVRDRLGEVDAALDDLELTLDRPRSGWLVKPVETRLDAVADKIADAAPRVATAWRVTSALPAMLGDTGPRTYLVLFTTPAEARGLGGFLGYYAELRADHGHLTMQAFGKASDLEARADAIHAKINAPAEFLERYRDWGFDIGPDGTVGEAPLRNLTETPNFPWVGEVSADLYAQVTGVKPDGVLAVDPYTIATLLGYTDGIQLTSVPATLSQGNVADFLIRGQYLTAPDNDQRIDALGEAAQKTISALLTGSLPDVTKMATDLGPLVTQRRLMMWAADPTERDLLGELGLSGEIPPPNGADGWSVAVTNGSGNKIDAFLERKAKYESRTDPATGLTTGRLRVELTNHAPASGLPAYVIGNGLGLPSGTSRLIVSFYTPLAVTEMACNGKPVTISAASEAGWNVFTTSVDIAPGATAACDLVMTGELARPDLMVTWTQPLASPMETLD